MTAGTVTTVIQTDPNSLLLIDPQNANVGELIQLSVNGTKLAQTSNVLINDLVTTAGNKDLAQTVRTAQTTFTLPQELVTKGYVDTSLAPVLGAVRYRGVYDGLNNVPDLVNAGPYPLGDYYVVSVSGMQLGISPNPLGVGDWVVRGPANWDVIEED